MNKTLHQDNADSNRVPRSQDTSSKPTVEKRAHWQPTTQQWSTPGPWQWAQWHWWGWSGCTSIGASWRGFDRVQPSEQRRYESSALQRYAKSSLICSAAGIVSCGNGMESQERRWVELHFSERDCTFQVSGGLYRNGMEWSRKERGKKER